MNKLSRDQLEALIHEGGKITHQENPTKHAGGRPRKDKEATAVLAARVTQLRKQGKKHREIKKQLDEETHTLRSEDTYRKLAKKRKKLR